MIRERLGAVRRKTVKFLNESDHAFQRNVGTGTIAQRSGDKVNHVQVSVGRVVAKTEDVQNAQEQTRGVKSIVIRGGSYGVLV